ncbi:hypothetical protein pb186bvf_018418 [Paramecium bursaria]
MKHRSMKSRAFREGLHSFNKIHSSQLDEEPKQQFSQNKQREVKSTQDMDRSTKKFKVIGSLTFRDFDVPTICLALRKKINIDSSKTLLGEEQDLELSPPRRAYLTQTQQCIPIPEDDDEIHSIWNDDENQYGYFNKNVLEEKNNQQQFLSLYKMRYGTFPHYRCNIENEIVIRMAIHLARIQKKMLVKYFPERSVHFDDDTDYSRIFMRSKKRFPTIQI